MIKPPSTQRLTAKLLTAVCLLVGVASTLALSTDKDQPIEIEADEAELDDLHNVSIYRGNVIVVQGSIYMTGEVMTVYNTEEDKLDYLIMDGNPATYKQLPDNSTVYDQARALRMEYYELKNQVILIGDAWVKQETSTLTGERIEYDTELSKVKAWSSPEGDGGGITTKKKERVRLIIKKRTKPTCDALKDPAREAGLEDKDLRQLKQDCQ